MSRHYVQERFLSRTVGITLIGCGGNGSQMLTGLARLNHAIKALGHPGLDVTVFDPDVVSEANMGRQLFSPADVGHNKAHVSVNRLNAFFGVRWRAEPLLYAYQHGRTDIMIACVDSTRARKAISVEIQRNHDNVSYLMDLGNRAADGQVILGEWAPEEQRSRPNDHVALANPYTVLPELVDLGLPGDDAPSCGLAEALERQELFINQAIATPALAILWEFFRYGKLSWHGAFVNLRTGNTRPMIVRTA